MALLNTHHREKSSILAKFWILYCEGCIVKTFWVRWENFYSSAEITARAEIRATWSLDAKSAFSLGLRKTTANIERVALSPDLSDAQGLTAGSPAFKYANSSRSPHKCSCSVLKCTYECTYVSYTNIRTYVTRIYVRMLHECTYECYTNNRACSLQWVTNRLTCKNESSGKEAKSWWQLSTLNQQNAQCSSLDMYIIISHWLAMHISIHNGSKAGN